MRTINISIPNSLADLIYREVKQGGFASVSEYIRNIIRARIFEKETGLKLEVFEKRPLEEIRRDFEGTGLYSKKFIDRLIKGLAESSIYADKAASK